MQAGIKAGATAAWVVVGAMALAPAGVWAQAHGSHGSHGAKAPATASAQAEGEVRALDAAAQTVTLKHGEMKALKMPAMTMAFKASKPELLQGLKVGDKVRFSAEMPSGVLTVTALERLP